MKGCQHDQTIMEDECDCLVPHTNSADAGLPHDSLLDYILELQVKLNHIYTLASNVEGHMWEETIAEIRREASLLS